MANNLADYNCMLARKEQADCDGGHNNHNKCTNEQTLNGMGTIK